MTADTTLDTEVERLKHSCAALFDAYLELVKVVNKSTQWWDPSITRFIGGVQALHYTMIGKEDLLDVIRPKAYFLFSSRDKFDGIKRTVAPGGAMDRYFTKLRKALKNDAKRRISPAKEGGVNEIVEVH